MAITTGLQEPSFADALTMIDSAGDLSAVNRQHWSCSVRQIAKALDRPSELIPARWSAIQASMGQLHHVPLGLTAKTLANHRSNVKAAVLWLHREKGVPAHGAPLIAEWARLKGKLTDGNDRSRFSPLMRFCSAAQVTPDDVDETVIDRYLDYRGRATTRPCDAASRRVLARLWNSKVGKIEGWPSRRLIEPPIKTVEGPAWESFPEGLRRDVESYLAGLTRIRRNRAGQRLRPCKRSTITTRRRELGAAAKMAIKAGVRIEELTSLGALLAPNVVEKILDAYWQQNGEAPKAFTIDLAGHFASIARNTGCIDAEGCKRLNELREALEDHRRKGLTEKNEALIRQVLTDGVWSRVVNLPAALMRKARSQRDHAPQRAAVAAQLSAAIAILTFAPVRLGNLAAIRLGTNLIKPGGPEGNYWLVFPDHDVKNRVKLEFPFDEELIKLLDEYIHEHRPVLLNGSNEDWLFPGKKRGAFKNAISFATQIVKRIHKETGLRMTVHQFRHAAGALILQNHPGNYELVRRVLGQRNIQTTINSYIGLESTQASAIFGSLVRERIRLDPEAA